MTPDSPQCTGKRVREAGGSGKSQTSFSGFNCSLIGSNPDASAGGRRPSRPHPFPRCPLGPCTPTPASFQLQAQTSCPSFHLPPPTSNSRPSKSNSELLLIQRGTQGIFPGNLARPAPRRAGGRGQRWAGPDTVRGAELAASSRAGVLAPGAEIRRWDGLHAVDKSAAETWGLQKRQGGS